jgi:hypothetical protein
MSMSAMQQSYNGLHRVGRTTVLQAGGLRWPSITQSRRRDRERLPHA